VDDCVNGAKFLAQQGLVDLRRIVISGGSAGGYTTLAIRDFFQGGASYYGVSDAAALARDTHKFESRYLDWLIGPYPEEEARYRERSPVYHADQLSKPVIFFQGSDDETEGFGWHRRGYRRRLWLQPRLLRGTVPQHHHHRRGQPSSSPRPSVYPPT
jgi:dipeptidyl aminopeptidase/acylaminoacyl peptidase